MGLADQPARRVCPELNEWTLSSDEQVGYVGGRIVWLGRKETEHEQERRGLDRTMRNNDTPGEPELRRRRTIESPDGLMATPCVHETSSSGRESAHFLVPGY